MSDFASADGCLERGPDQVIRDEHADRYLMRELERDSTDTHAPDVPLEALPPIAVIGRGRVGGSIASAAAVAGLDVRQAGREKFDEACAEAEIALLCVPDGEIEAACERAAAHAPGLRFIGHPSGATSLAALDAAVAHGATAFSLHPLQTVPHDRSGIQGAPAAIAAGNAEGLETARRLAAALGMRPFELPEEHRTAYHAAAAIASNFLVALEESAAGLLDAIGIDDARELLGPLVLRSAANWSAQGAAALTGPIARGDEATVAAHLEALRRSAPELVPMYEALAERTRKLAGAGEAGG